MSTVWSKIDFGGSLPEIENDVKSASYMTDLPGRSKRTFNFSANRPVTEVRYFDENAKIKLELKYTQSAPCITELTD